MDVEELYQRYGPMVMRRCRQLLKEVNEALDATQDVFVQILKRRDRLEMTYPSSLLYRIATNQCLNRIRDGQRRATMPGAKYLPVETTPRTTVPASPFCNASILRNAIRRPASALS
mgnify:CR=1 FL=1